MKTIKNVVEKVNDKMREASIKLITDESGDLLQYVIVGLIAIIIGGALLAKYTNIFETIGNLMENKIISVFQL